MEPQSRPSPEQSMPQPSGPEFIPDQSAADAQVEKAPAAPEREQQSGNAANQNQTSVPLPQVQPVPVAVPDPALDQPVDDVPSTPAGVPGDADDVDVIEKAWVDKAKNIVKKTHDNPRQQNNEVSHLKADYMQKRFGKQIKLPDDKA